MINDHHSAQLASVGLSTLETGENNSQSVGRLARLLLLISSEAGWLFDENY